MLSAHAAWRARIVPGPLDPVYECTPTSDRRVNHTWAELMRRGLAIDSLECPARCGGRLRLVALIERPDVVRRILDHLGLCAERADPAPARAPPGSDGLELEV